MARLSLFFLGTFRVLLDGQPVTRFESNRARALLAYLALESGRAHARDKLLGLLWPESPQSHALANLRDVLSKLRRTLAEPGAADAHLTITRETVQFDLHTDDEFDVASFADAAHAHSGETLDPERLEDVLSLYRGPLLDGLSLGNAAAYEDWVAARREALEQQVQGALLALAEHSLAIGEYVRAEQHARRLLGCDPTCEEGHRQLMRALALSGQRSAAIAQYQVCKRLLAQELEVEPARETTALFESIRQGTPAGLDQMGMPAPGPALAAGVATRSPAQPEPTFVGREQELARLGGWLEEALSGRGRVGFVVGDPGSGKTMLLRQVSHAAMQAHSGLLVASGSCNAFSGLGDPYLPFLEILQMLTGDIESRVAAGSISREGARRLREAYPVVLRALLEQSSELIDLLVPGALLLARVRELMPEDAIWQPRLVQLLRERGAPGSLPQPFLFERLTRFLQAVAAQHPLVLLIDDLQWGDLASIALLFHLGRRLAGHRILVLGAYRPEEVTDGTPAGLAVEGSVVESTASEPTGQHPLRSLVAECGRLWGDLRLDLSEADGRRFVDQLVDMEPNRLGHAFRETLYQHTAGQALFTVELLHGLQERGDLFRDDAGRWVEGPELHWERLPKRVEAVIASRMARLPREWQTWLTVASVEGEAFTAEVLARAAAADPAAVLDALSGPLGTEHRLVTARSVRRLGEQAVSGYRFRHNLFQNYLYQRLDEVQRAHLHEQVGAALEAVYGAVPRVALTDPDQFRIPERAPLWLAYGNGGVEGQAAAVATSLARHWEASGLLPRAVAYLQQAAERAMRLGAYQEALAHLTRCVALWASIPETPETIRQRYMAHFLLQWDVAVARGHAALERDALCLRALEIARQIGEPRLIRLMLCQLAELHVARAEFDKASELSQEIAALDDHAYPPNWVYDLSVHGQTLLHRGELAAARQPLEQTVTYYDAKQLTQQSLPAKMHQAHYHLAYVLWLQGYPDQAARATHRACEMAWDIDAGHRLWAIVKADAVEHQLAGEATAAGRATDQVLAHREERDSAQIWPMALVLSGWTHSVSGLPAQGIAEMQEGIAELSRAGYRLMLSHFKALLAEGYWRAGQPEDGLKALQEAFEHVERTGERYYEAELHRLRGELLLQRQRVGCSAVDDEAEACFLQAIAVARQQGARSLELRATLSLCRLWQSQGRRAPARQMLAAIYGWFTEGFDKPDLVEARALLSELAA